MKKINITSICLLILGCFYVKAQTDTENYIYVQEPLIEVTNITTNTSAKRSVQYFDGLGRPKQTVIVKGSSTTSSGLKDLIIPVEYDEFGRQAKDHLPFPSNVSNGNIVTNYTSLITAQYGGQTAYSEKKLENSPLGRVLEQAAPGSSWNINSGHTIKFEYLANEETDNVYKYTAETGWTHDWPPPSTSRYPANTLYKTITTDENGEKIIEFKNKQGQVILKRTYVTIGQLDGRPTNSAQKADTYYVYDIYGNLTYVLPPLASANTTLTPDLKNDLIYQYKYDEKNRLIEKKLPGKGWEYMVYDNQDRLVATQDENLKIDSLWLFTKYDQFGRTVYTGIYKSVESREDLKTKLKNNFGSNNENFSSTGFTKNILSIKYKNNAFPTSQDEILTVNYYDEYRGFTFNGNSSFNSIKESGITIPTDVTLRSGVELKGMPTDSYIKIIGQDDWEHYKPFYDQKSRLVISLKDNHLGGFTESSHDLDFRGKAKSTTTYHKRSYETGDKIVYTKDEFTYDSQERLTLHTKRLSPSSLQYQVIALNKYNAIGQLSNKKVGGTSPTGANRWQDIDYRYNIRGWLTAINDMTYPLSGEGLIPTSLNDGLFAFRIVYENLNETANPHAKRLYNGNIAQTYWKTGVDNITRAYSYKYDELNRLVSAVHHNPQSNNKYSGAYDEHLSYDLNGNIRFLIRNTGDALGTNIGMDNLTYTYKNGYANSNQLVKVADAVSTTSTGGFVDGYTGTLNDYEYDANGNMIKDRNKGISEIVYNHLNLPTHITIDNQGTIEYLYNAVGQKVMKQVHDTSISPQGNITIVDYLDGYQYAGRILQFFPHPEGYVKATLNQKSNNYQFDYVYNYTDHLGNVRVSYTKDPVSNELKILEENHYYPFGLKHSLFTSGGKKDYKFDENAPEGAEELARPGFVTSIPYKYKYNGKELQDELGLNMYAMDMRQYDPTIARWVVMDPVTHHSMSPYNSFDNNPVFWADPSGADSRKTVMNIFYQSGSGTTLWTNNNNGTFSGSNGETYECDDCKLEGGEFNSKSFDEIETGQLDKWYQPVSFKRNKFKLMQEDVDDYLESTIITLEETSGQLKFYAALLGVSPASLIKKAGSIQKIKLKDLLNLKKYNLASASAFVLGANLYAQGMKLDQVRAQMRIIENDNSFEKAKSIYIISEIRVTYGLNGASTTNSYFYYNADNQKFIGSTFDFY